ncbi:MAG: branched-chain amino acid ABC transporter permease [Actinobacteria bacterium]|nr:branched-chain amino acid ABC transporter permease [Actinomycetota bacterium]
MTQRSPIGRIVAVVLVVLLVAAPFIPVTIPVVFSGPLNSPGVLNLLALMLIFGALALTYDLLFGFTGLLSFGHALYFAVGVYMTTIAVTHWGFTLLPAIAVTLVVGLVLATALGAVCLRVGDIAFAMVTLAFAQAGAIFVLRDPLRITGGEEGTPLAFRRLPEIFVGVVNTRYVYWVALAFAVLVYAVARWVVHSRAGRVWQAIRENEQRVEVLGLRPYSFKLLSFVVASVLATLGGIVYVLLLGGASPGVTTATFTLTLLVMVVLGGTGTLWGAVLGGALYTYLNQRLVSLAGAQTVQDLPDVLSTPLSEPLFILGTLFVLLVVFFPGGIAGLRDAAVGQRAAGLVRRLVPSGGSGAEEEVR